MVARTARDRRIAPGRAAASIVRAPLSADDDSRGSGPVRIRRGCPIVTVEFRNSITPTFGVGVPRSHASSISAKKIFVQFGDCQWGRP
jgi:hypothetical protein